MVARDENSSTMSVVISVGELFYRITATRNRWEGWDFQQCVQVKPERYTAIRYVEVKR